MELAKVRWTLGPIGCVIQGGTGQFGNQGDMLQMIPLQTIITGAVQLKPYALWEVEAYHGEADKGRPMLSITSYREFFFVPKSKGTRDVSFCVET